MIVRICPECNKVNVGTKDSNKKAEYWRCSFCPTKISIDFQEER